MLSRNVVKQCGRNLYNVVISTTILARRGVHNDGRNRLSSFFIPTQRRPSDLSEPEYGHDLLIRAGFLRQAYSGIFHLLPLGLRVQNKVEQLIDRHMLRIGASKVSLSSISSQELWQLSGRLDKGRTSELLQFEDRKGAKYLLSPTHEEEITTIISNAVHSYKELPLRLYQVSRKYRDEPRPRQGLLRGREFLMKDLYTFDVTEDAARQTYEEVREAYVAFLEELKLPYLVARADSGNMGGSLSHEYHFASSQGEDIIVTCDKCTLSMNEELYIGRYEQDQSNLTVGMDGESQEPNSSPRIASEHYVSKDRKRLCSIHYSSEHGAPNIYAVKAIFPEVDTGLHGEQAKKEYRPDLSHSTQSHIQYRDPRLVSEVLAENANIPLDEVQQNYRVPTVGHEIILLTKAKEDDACPSCKGGRLRLQQAVEIGHTFHLGHRYSVPLEANVLDVNNRKVPIEMGCHGIGVSRLVGAIAALLADSKGLNWPLAISPFDVVIVPAGKVTQMDVQKVYDLLASEYSVRRPLDVVIDDRDKPIGWKLNDGDLIGYPFIVVMGNAWKDGIVEVQCRQLGINVQVSLDDLVPRVQNEAQKL